MTTTFSLFTLLLVVFLFSSACTAQPPYFINCGSSDNVSVNMDWVFHGDENTDIVRFSHHSKTIKDTKQSADPSLYKYLYQTARVFNRPSTYDFNLPQNGTYFVRLHFYAFSSSLADAKFNVSASGHMLLPDFIPTNYPIMKEFILTINEPGKFRIYFVPSSSSYSAFVNAIQVLSITSNITEDSGPHVTPLKRKGDNKGQKPEALETIYRINVGGNEVKPLSDNYRRYWEPDDPYLINKGDAKNANDSSSNIDYSKGEATMNDAPSVVYGTAKVLKSSQSYSKSPNLTWKFNVTKDSKYFLRVHLCDIQSSSPNLNNFTFYIYSNFSQVIKPEGPDIPFYRDYVAESNNLDFINISVGPNKAFGKNFSEINFLNGLEIMQVKNEIAQEPTVDNASRHVLRDSLLASAAVLIVFLAGIVTCLYQRKRKHKASEAFEWGNLSLYDATSSHNRASESASSHASTFQNLHLGLKIPFAAIQQVTNNFDVNLIIGEGGFGKVYKGTLASGLKIAVKRGSSDHGQGIAEFQTEIMILSKIRHRHLVSLIGYCYENGEMILVYEFMEKGTLRGHLYDPKEGAPSSTPGGLSWKQRLEICIGAAKGIQYLHSGTNMGIIHRDVKSTNILLDENYMAKVADFGLSRSGFLEESHVSISDVKGTLGYLDPEYITCLQLTEKSDVYSFGMVLLEVLCARPVIDQSLPKEQISLSEWAISCYDDGQIETIIDPFIAAEINTNSLKKFCEIAKRCLQKDAAERPHMSDVCWGLEYALQLQKVASERVLLDDSTIDASLNMPLPVVRRFPSQSIVDHEFDDELLDTSTGEVFSQLTIDDDGTGR